MSTYHGWIAGPGTVSEDPELAADIVYDIIVPGLSPSYMPNMRPERHAVDDNTSMIRARVGSPVSVWFDADRILQFRALDEQIEFGQCPTGEAGTNGYISPPGSVELLPMPGESAGEGVGGL